MEIRSTAGEMGPRYQPDFVRTTEEWDAVFNIRIGVFVEEQAVPREEELDAYDRIALHFLVRNLMLSSDDRRGIVATARLVDKGNGVGKVGRVAVLRDHRGRGVGALLMRFVEETARCRGFTRLDLDAQCSAIPFYEKLGYKAHGDLFLDANIEHRQMHKAI